MYKHDHLYYTLDLVAVVVLRAVSLDGHEDFVKHRCGMFVAVWLNFSVTVFVRVLVLCVYMRLMDLLNIRCCYGRRQPTAGFSGINTYTIHPHAKHSIWVNIGRR